MPLGKIDLSCSILSFILFERSIRLVLGCLITAINIPSWPLAFIFVNSMPSLTCMSAADIQVKEGIEFTKINANGQEGMLIAVIKQPNTNLIDLSNKMKDKIEQLKSILPKGIIIKPYYIQADFVNESVKSVSESLW